MSSALFEEEEVVNAASNQFAESSRVLNPAPLRERGGSHETEPLLTSRRSQSILKSTHQSTLPVFSDNGLGSSRNGSRVVLSEDYEDTILDSPSEEGEEGEEEQDDGNVLKPEFSSLPCRTRPSYKLVRFALLLQILGLMTAVTSQIDAIIYLVCQDHFKNSEPTSTLPGGIAGTLTDGYNQGFQDPRCFSPDISASVAVFQTYMSTITSILGVVVVPFLTSCSDRLGRRPLLIWNMSCGILSLSIVLICCVFPDKVNYKLFLLSSVLDGLGGTMVCLLILASSYISDIVKDKHRASVMSVLDAFLFGGVALGPMLGSNILTITDHNLLILFSFSLTLQVIALSLIVFVLPESRSRLARAKSLDEHLTRRKSFLSEQRRRMSTNASHWDDESFVPEFSLIEKVREIIHHVNILGPLQSLKFSHITDRKTRFNAILIVIAQATLTELSMASIPFVILYAKTKFSWTSVENGYFISFLGTSRFIFLSVVLPFAINLARKRWTQLPKQIDIIDKRFLQFGIVFSMLGHVLLAEAPTGSAFMTSTLVIAIGSGTTPLLRNAIIKFSPEDKVGQVLGATSLLSRMSNIFLPAVFAFVYTSTVRKRMQAIIEVIALTELVVFGLLSLLYVGSATIEDVESMVGRA